MLEHDDASRDAAREHRFESVVDLLQAKSPENQFVQPETTEPIRLEESGDVPW